MVTFKDPDNISQEDYNNKVEDVSKKSEQNNIRLGALSTLLRKQDNFLKELSMEKERILRTLGELEIHEKKNFKTSKLIRVGLGEVAKLK